MGRDLDLDYETPGQAYAAFKDVTADDAIETLLEHSKEYYSDTITTQGVIRDKAKLLLGTTSFTLAVFSGGVALLKESFGGAPTWLVVVMSLLFVVIVVHFARALWHALETITREETCAVSTQDVLAAVVVPESGLSETKRRLAADYRSAATQTAKYLVKRKLGLMLAQGCLKWGLILTPGLFFCSLLAAYIKPNTEIPTWAKPLVNDVGNLQREQLANRTRVDSLDHGLATLDGALQELKVNAATIQSVQADLGLALDRVKNNSRDLHGLVQSFPDRLKKLEEQVEKANRQLQELTKDVKNVPGTPSGK
jgi:hypothetical protein